LHQVYYDAVTIVFDCFLLERLRRENLMPIRDIVQNKKYLGLKFLRGSRVLFIFFFMFHLMLWSNINLTEQFAWRPRAGTATVHNRLGRSVNNGSPHQKFRLSCIMPLYSRCSLFHIPVGQSSFERHCVFRAE